MRIAVFIYLCCHPPPAPAATPTLETGVHYVALAILKLTEIHQPLLLKCWGINGVHHQARLLLFVF